VSGAPLSYLGSAGAKAQEVVPLTWFALIVSTATCLIFAWLIVAGVRRGRAEGDVVSAQAVVRGGNGLRWIFVSLVLATVPIAVMLVWTMIALADTGVPPLHPALVLEATPQQYWWQVRYRGARPSDTFTTANEIHIPVGAKVLVRLSSPDVIHSFWVPQLSGKTDAIPGQNNVTWLQANRPGRYRGQCAEFCGAQHARMGFEVVAQSPSDFEIWRRRQLQTAPPPVTPEQVRGLAIVEYRCAICHSVRGTLAGANSAPDLTHLMSRATLAAAQLPNNPGSLRGWIENPQAVKPGTQMPNQHLDATQLNDVAAYLGTLR
jgi:cytochrome c oxidase subunit 2